MKSALIKKKYLGGLKERGVVAPLFIIQCSVQPDNKLKYQKKSQNAPLEPFLSSSRGAGEGQLNFC